MNLHQYIETVNKRFQSGIAKEHAYRADLESLIRELAPDVEVTNEPANVTDCGNPDFVITKGKIPIGFIEAKDLGKDLASKSFKDQFDRYRKALDNLIITDYLWFRFYQNRELVAEIHIGQIGIGRIDSLAENFDEFANLIRDFCTYVGQTIKAPKRLAEMMAAKARLLESILEKAVTSDEETQENTSLQQQYKTFKSILIHDLKPKEFADIYSQTLAYGMFAARLHDPTLDTFSRQEAAELIPKTNPFLRKLFNHVAGIDIDDRIRTTVDNLADVFRATDVAALLKNFGRSTMNHDPIIHFYETFLAEYDPKLRKSRGVWYTPEPVVNFIVRSVDEILKDEFGLKDGLADTTKTIIKLKQSTADKRKKVDGQSGYTNVEKEVHKVQVLDPATGTGTFLAEVIKLIYEKKFQSMQGAWSGYVEKHLIPRLNGFEILMASYAMAHLKLDMLLTETGYYPQKEQRFNIFLTNSLEEHHPDTGTLFASWLSTEANEANHVKRDTPVMVVLGNPPYSVSSSNKGNWIQKLLVDYKKGLNEKKINLDDDYIKFIRYGQYYIDKNGEGILAYISNNSFIDGVTHRQMRQSLLNSFDEIYILDLHGSTKKNEKTPEGKIDKNVFDIMQGVSINIFVRNNKKKPNKNSKVFHADVFGSQENKYSFLSSNGINTINWTEVEPNAPYNFFVPKNFESEEEYTKGFKLSELFSVYNNGLQTDRDSLFIDFDRSVLEYRMKILFDGTYDNEFKETYRVHDSSSYKLSKAIHDNQFISGAIQDCLYRPFDYRKIYYDPKVISRPAQKVLKHIRKENPALIISRQQSTFDFQHVFVTNILTERCSISLQTKETGYVFPLYLYPDTSLEFDAGRFPNFNKNIIQSISHNLDLSFAFEKINEPSTFSPIDLLDYIYAVLHSPTYRKVYKEFLKIDFPRIPYPKDAEKFWLLVKLGGELRQIHLLDSPVIENHITTYPASGDNMVTRKITQTSPGYKPTSDTHGKVWINDTQYFDHVPLVAWAFFIGGYQPAQKWLKDRSGRTLNYDDILHYQKIIVALTETDRIMKEIDLIDV